MTESVQHSQDPAVEKDRVILAYRTVASLPSDNVSKADRDAANRYLTSFQGTQVAWLVCDMILRDETQTTVPQEAMNLNQQRFFAACTLHAKCQTDVLQLHPAELPSLRDSLFTHLTRYARIKNVALTTQIAMAIAALSVQMKWTTLITDIFKSITHGAVEQEEVILLLINVIPEEFCSERLIVAEESVLLGMRDHLIASATDVFRFLESLFHAQQHPVVLKAFLNWIKYVPLRPHDLMSTSLMNSCFQALTTGTHELAEVAVDAIVEVLRMYPSYKPGNQGLVEKMVPLLMQLPIEAALHSDVEDVLRTYCRIITETGESYMTFLLSKDRSQSLQLVQWILHCSSIQEIEISSMTLHFWSRLVDELDSVEPYGARQELVDYYTSHLTSFVQVCSQGLMKYPLDLHSSTPDELEDFKRNRRHVAETIGDCCRLIGGSLVLERIANDLQEESKRLNASNATEWQGIESCISCVNAIYRYIPSDESKFMPFFFELIPRLPAEIGPLRASASELIGRYASWLSNHAHLLQPLLPYLAQGLSQPECSAAAAVAIKELCRCSNEQMLLGKEVLSLYNQITASKSLALAEELEVLEGACVAISRESKASNSGITAVLPSIVTPIGSSLQGLLANDSIIARALYPDLDRLTVVVRFLTSSGQSGETEMILEMVKSASGLLDQAINQFPSDDPLAEKICRFHKHSIRSCGAMAYAPLFDALADHLKRSYELSHRSAFLYAASICVSEYGPRPHFTDNLFSMIGSLATTSFSFLRSLDDLISHPDVVEELFYLMGRVVNTCPEPLFLGPFLMPLFHCATAAMHLDHPNANNGTLNFLESAIGYGAARGNPRNPQCLDALNDVLSKHGETIVDNIIGALVGDLPAYRVHDGNGSLAGILWRMIQFCPKMTFPWTSKALEARAPPTVRERFARDIEAASNRDDFNRAVWDFLRASHRYRKLNKGAR